MATAPVTRALPALRPVAAWLLRPVVLLPLAFAASAFWLAWQAGHVTSFVWMIDEALYVKEAQGYADLQGLMPHVHGQRYGVPNVLYPLLLAPLYAFLDAPDAFKAAHILNGIAWASTMFPVYLLARRLEASWPWALLAGVLSVWVPWAVAVAVVMTESVTYPAFAWALFAMTVAVASPRPRHDAFALAAILLAIAGRTQFVFLLAGFVLAVVLHALALREPGVPWWRRLRAHWMLGALLAGGALAVLAITLVDSAFLGGYSVVTGLPPFPNGLWLAAGQHLAHVVVGVGILPAILYGAWLFGVATQERPRPGHLAFAVVGTVTLGLLIYQAAFFQQNVGAVMQERYVSYAAPILFVGMVAFATTRYVVAPRLALVASAVVTAIAVVGAQHLESEAGNAFDSVANGSAAYISRTGPWLGDLTNWIPGRPLSAVEALVLVTIVLGVVAAVAVAGRWRRYALPALCLAVLVYTVDATRFTVPRVVLGIDTGFPYSLAGVRETPRDWVDRATPDDSLVGMKVGRLGVNDEGNQWLWTMFWNKSIKRTYSYDGLMGHSGWPGEKWELDARTGLLATPEPPDYLVTSQIDPELRVEGEIVQPSAYNAVVVRVAKPLRAKWALDEPKGRPTLLRVFGVEPGAPAEPLELTLTADTPPPELGGPVEFPYVITDGDSERRGTLKSGEQRKVVVRPTATGDGPAIVKVDMRPKALPEGEARLRIISVAEVGR